MSGKEEMEDGELSDNSNDDGPLFQYTPLQRPMAPKPGSFSKTALDDASDTESPDRTLATTRGVTLTPSSINPRRNSLALASGPVETRWWWRTGAETPSDKWPRHSRPRETPRD